MTATSAAASFSPDGSRIVTASNDRTARVWDAASGGELARFGDVNSASFSPDRARIVTASGDTARVWRIARTTQQLVDAAKQRVPRCLSPSDRAHYFLPAAPPLWCITGAGLETEKDPAKWQPKWPYRSAAWRDWLAARRAWRKSACAEGGMKPRALSLAFPPRSKCVCCGHEVCGAIVTCSLPLCQQFVLLLAPTANR